MIRRTLAALACAAACSAAQPATVDLHADGKPLLTVIEALADACEAGLSIEAEVHPRLAASVRLAIDDARWADALRLLRDQYRLAITLDGARLRVGDADAADRSRLVVRVYDVRHLHLAPVDRPGPSLHTPQPGGTGSQLLPPAAASGASTLDLMQTVIQEVGAGAWSETIGTAIEDRNEALVVTQLPEVHERIAAILAGLERDLLRQVQVRLWRLPADRAGLGAPRNAAEVATITAPLGAPQLTVVTAPGQRAHGHAGVARRYISDSDVVQERHDPITATLLDGLMLDVTPSPTRAGIVVTCRFQAAATTTMAETQVQDDTGRPLLAIALPDRRLESLRQTVVIPDGGAAILRSGSGAWLVQTQLYPPAP
ncbi:MAG TPA: hypothetical protein DCS97_01310 [Planctomycetes bacterium]|nr:hypothetical protein [Planctomycetota bacterium]